MDCRAGVAGTVLQRQRGTRTAAHGRTRHEDDNAAETEQAYLAEKDMAKVNKDDNAAEAEQAYLAEKDKANVNKDARWVRKAGRLRLEYKRHTVMDINALILAEETTPANESDTNHMEVPLEKAALPPQTPVYADKGYSSAKNRKMLADRRLKSRIMHKAEKGRPLTQRQKQVNRGISSVRYRVERAFGSIRRWFGGGIARYVGLAKTHAQHIMEAIAYNLYRAPRLAMDHSAGVPGALMCLF